MTDGVLLGSRIGVEILLALRNHFHTASSPVGVILGSVLDAGVLSLCHHRGLLEAVSVTSDTLLVTSVVLVGLADLTPNHPHPPSPSACSLFPASVIPNTSSLSVLVNVLITGVFVILALVLGVPVDDPQIQSERPVVVGPPSVLVLSVSPSPIDFAIMLAELADVDFWL